MGDNSHYPEEGPAHKVSVRGFWIDAHEVSNAQFATFVDATHYVTVAERIPNPADWPADVPEDFLKQARFYSPLRSRAKLRQTGGLGCPAPIGDTPMGRAAALGAKISTR